MRKPSIEPLEQRVLFSALNLNTVLTTADVTAIVTQAAAVSEPGQTIVVVDRNGDILALYGQAPSLANQNIPGTAPLSQLQFIDSATKSLAGPLAQNTAAKYALIQATARARTAAAFESTQDAFTSRTARFIVQDDFPQPIIDTEAGPLLGVEFSDALGTDAVPAIGTLGGSENITGLAAGLSGDPGGIPLFINGVPVGAIGVAGDGSDVAARADLAPQAIPGFSFNQQSPAYKSDPTGAFYNGAEESDFDEAVALAGAQNYMASAAIQSTQILVNGLRLPFTAEAPATAAPAGAQGLTNVVGQILPPRQFFAYASLGKATSAITAGLPSNSLYPAVQIPLTTGGVATGFAENNDPKAGGAGDNPSDVLTDDASKLPNGAGGFTLGNFGYIPGDPVDTGPTHLTIKDISTIISEAATQASITRAAIREPADVPAGVYISVTDTDGNILGVFSTADATNFSFDVAVQKARTASYFSDDTHAFSSRAIGFMADGTFPPSIADGVTGPLYHLQEDLSLPFNQAAYLPMVTQKITNGTTLQNPLGNGITIFPGGAPLYKNGKLVGAIGISGDGVDQDDLIAFAGTAGYRASTAIQSDNLSETNIINFLESKINALATAGFTFLPVGLESSLFDFHDPEAINLDGITTSPFDNIIDRIIARFNKSGLQGVRLPFQKFPRNPNV